MYLDGLGRMNRPEGELEAGRLAPYNALIAGTVAYGYLY